MRSPAKYLGLLAVFATGVVAAVFGFARLALLHDIDGAAPAAVLGLALVAWVIFHPARVSEESLP